MTLGSRVKPLGDSRAVGKSEELQPGRDLVPTQRTLGVTTAGLRSPGSHYSRDVRTPIDSHFTKCVRILCQNCVRCPLKPRSNRVIYGDTSMHIVVAGSR